MWPSCINNLSPVEDNLGKRLPDWIEQAFNKKGVSDKDEMFVPLFPISAIGTCKTSAYIECPNIPEHHVEHAEDGSDIGRYYWFDFDVVGADNKRIELRMALNEGDADCNDGFWGAVWERSTQELVVNILSSGDMETTIEAVSRKYVRMYKPHETWIPMLEENVQICENNLQLEKLVDLAIQICLYPNAEIIEGGVRLGG